MKTIDLRGRFFGQLSVISRLANDRNGKAMWLCRCTCGVTKPIRGVTMLRGEARSCGCMKAAISAATSTTHGRSGTRVYRIWAAMKTRCGNPNVWHYEQYGARGILVCDRWQSFENFLADMGDPPTEKHTLDRKDNAKGYEPGNCRWASAKEQSANSRKPRVIEFGGCSMNISEWARHLGINQSSLHERLGKWPIEQALSARKSHRWSRRQAS